MKPNLAWYGGQKRHYPAVKTVEAEASGAERLVSLARLFFNKGVPCQREFKHGGTTFGFFLPYLLCFLFASV
jgi:hypothetical protein